MVTMREVRKMRNSVIMKLYTPEEIQKKINEHMNKYEDSRIKNDYKSMISTCYDIACLYELLNDKEKSGYYYQKVIDEWNAHPDKFAESVYINTLKKLHLPKEALKVVLKNPRKWGIETLALLYEELGNHGEALLLYAGMATCSYKIARVHHPFWRPHYFQEAADLRERAQHTEIVSIYNQQAVKAWEKVKDNIGDHLELIEKAWLLEEVGYIYEKAEKFETAMEYYEKSKALYEQAYDEDPTAVSTHHIDGDWDEYWGFFIHQIPDFRFVHFHLDGPEENDYRRMKYRILNLKEQMK